MDLQDLVNGFLDEAGKLKQEGEDYRFIFDKGKSFSISGEKGFDRFAFEVFPINKDGAFWAASTVLTSEQLKELGWKRVHDLRALKLFEKVEKLSAKLEEESAEKTESNKKLGDLRREKGKLIETLISDNRLRNFFEREKLTFSPKAFKRNKDYKFPFSDLSLEKQNSGIYKQDQEGYVKGEIDVFMPSEPFDGSAIVVEMKYNLNLNDVNKFLSTLEVVHLIYSSERHRSFRGALAFYEVEDNKAKQRANEAGLYLIQITQAEIRQANSPGFQFASF